MDIIPEGTLQITPEMLMLISEIDEFKGAWQHWTGITPDRLLSLKRVATIESIGSSTRIEGSKLSDQQVEALLSQVQPHSFESRDEQEVASYAFACSEICNHYQSIPLSENALKQLHTWVLQHTEKDIRHRGEYKKIPISIEAFDSSGGSLGVIFETTSPFETPYKMHDLIKWTQEAFELKRLHPLIVIGIFTVVFLAIHPFQDGNGRLSRLLTTLLMLQNGYTYVPYSSLESIIEANKESYYFALQRTQKSWQRNLPEWAPWLTFFFECLHRQQIHLKSKLTREKILLQAYSSLEQQILKLLQDQGQLKIGGIERLTHANRNTLKKALTNLVKQDAIAKHGVGKATFYTISS